MIITYKKAGLILLFLAITGFVAFLLFTLFFKSQSLPTPIPQQNVNTGNGLPQSNPGTFIPTDLTEGQLPNGGTGSDTGSGSDIASPKTDTISEQASFATINASGLPQFYNTSDNRFYTVNPAGELITLSNQQFFGVDNVTWSPNGQRAIIEYPDGNNIRYDFSTESQVTLPQHWKNFSFSPSGTEVAAKSIGLDPGNRWLVVSNDDGSKARTIEPLGENGDKVISSWSPNNQSIAFYVDGIDFNRKEVYLIGQNGENFKSLTTEGRGFQPLWAPNGNELVYSVYSADNDFKPSLWVVEAQGDAIGSNRRPLNLNTWAEKCSFNNNDLYCAVPLALERGAGMFPAAAQNTQDLLYKINLSTGQRERINISTTSSISNISLSADGTYLYYIEGDTNRLKKVKIK